MDSSLFDHPGNRIRPPDWRWKLARLLREDESLRLRPCDEWTGRARRAQEALDRHGDDPEHPAVVESDPDVAAAYALGRCDGRLLGEIRARLLAGQEDGAISARTGVPIGALNAYEKLHFNVRDGLARSDWVAGHCLGPRFFAELREDDVELIMAWLGYTYGSDALDLLIDAPYGGSPGGRAGVGPEDAELAEGLRGAIALLALPRDAAWGRMVLELAARQEWLDREHADRQARPVAGPIVARIPDLGALRARPGIAAGALDTVPGNGAAHPVSVSASRARAARSDREFPLERPGRPKRMA
jgi:hypothetical protein